MSSTKADLSPTQIQALEYLEHAGVSGLEASVALVFLGNSHRRTLESLEKRGLVRYFATPGKWRITPAGRAVVDSLPKTPEPVVVCSDCEGNQPPTLH